MKDPPAQGLTDTAVRDGEESLAEGNKSNLQIHERVNRDFKQNKYHLYPQISLCRVNKIGWCMASLPHWNKCALTHLLDLPFRQRCNGHKDMSSRLERFLLRLSVVLLQTIQLFLCYPGYIKISFLTIYRHWWFGSITSRYGQLSALVWESSYAIIKWFMCQNLNCISKRVQIPILQVRILCKSSLLQVGVFPPQWHFNRIPSFVISTFFQSIQPHYFYVLMD